ncbi:MAG TPA: HipA domain-containing protein [Gemmatimonadaceae bacterium]|nr:HipA domain-containing protein [Gemmatimonadaceae bacterium]
MPFGVLIGNTDRHQHNILLFSEGARLRLAPAFDQVSMMYAPTADGQVPPRVFEMPNATSDTQDVWDVHATPRVSSGHRSARTRVCRMTRASSVQPTLNCWHDETRGHVQMRTMFVMSP